MAPIPPPAASGTTVSTDVPLYWARYGRRGAPALLVLHGGPGAHHDYLLPQMLALADLGAGHELLFYDQRGGGRSRVDAQHPVTWETQVADLGAVAREFGLERPVLVGYSWGGLLAMLYAVSAQADDRLPKPAAMVLIDPAPITRQYRQEFEHEFGRRSTSADVKRLRAELAESHLRESDPVAYRQRNFELSVAGYFANPADARDLTPFRVNARVQHGIWDSLGQFDLAADARWRAVRVPTLVVHGRQDPIPLASSEAAARLLGARLVVIEECGHVPYVEQPRALFDAIGSFLGTLPPDAQPRPAT